RRIVLRHRHGVPGRRRSHSRLRNPGMTMRYLEDFAAGQKFGSGRLRIEKERIKSFAAEFDPQPFHLDEAAARGSIFGGLAASGWHTAALTMRLLVESELKPAGGIVGAGFDEFRWPRPGGLVRGKRRPARRGADVADRPPDRAEPRRDPPRLS